jgi:hypothetical protein
MKLFDHLVGEGEHRLRDRQPERRRGLQVDDQLELGRKFDRQIAWLRALENLDHVRRRAVEVRRQIDSIADSFARRWVPGPQEEAALGTTFLYAERYRNG